MNQQQTLLIQSPEKLPHSSRIAPEEETPAGREEEKMVKIPILGTIDSKTGKITFYNNNNKKL